MGKTKESQREFFARMAKDHPGVLRSDNTVLYCLVCDCSVSATQKSHVVQHIRSQTHTKKVESQSQSTSRQTLLTEHQQPRTEKINEFSMDVCKSFLEANIPLKKAAHPSVKNLFEKYTKKTMPSESVLRQKFVSILYNETLDRLREKSKDKHIWVSIDESTDSEQRMVVSFIFGILDGDENSPERGKCYLLNMAVVEAVNASTMAAFFNDSLLSCSTDVERSFSTYKGHLTEKRKSFLFENLKQHCIVHCNREK